MAEKEDIEHKKDALNDPILKELFSKVGYPKTLVVLKVGMTTEEEEMEILNGLLQEGYSVQDAELKAKEYAKLMNSF